MKTQVIVIGRGPSGITAAIYLKRANIDVVVIGKDGGVLEQVSHIENYYPFSDISGKELQKKGEQQAQKFNIPIIEEEVIEIKYIENNKFKVITNKNEYETEYIYLGMGKDRKRVRIKNIEKFQGKGISYCAVCDGFIYKDKDISVLGNTEYTINEVKYLENVARKTYILTDGETPIDKIKELEKNNKNIQIIAKKIKQIDGEDRVEKLVFEDNETIDIKGIFIAEELDTKSLAKKLGLTFTEDDIETNENQKTNIPNVYAGGDATKGIKQIIKATNDGMIAGLDIAKNIVIARNRGKNE